MKKYPISYYIFILSLPSYVSFTNFKSKYFLNWYFFYISKYTECSNKLHWKLYNFIKNLKKKKFNFYRIFFFKIKQFLLKSFLLIIFPLWNIPLSSYSKEILVYYYLFIICSHYWEYICFLDIIALCTVLFFVLFLPRLSSHYKHQEQHYEQLSL